MGVSPPWVRIPPSPPEFAYLKANDYAGGNTESTYDSGTSEDLQTYTRKTGVYPACWTIGSTAWGFTTYVLIQNPNPVAANITITYMTPNGPINEAPFSMPAESRKTIRVNDDHPDTDISTRVHGDKPVIAERAMYWNVDTYLDDGTIITEEACHDSIGMSATHRIFIYQTDRLQKDEKLGFWYRILIILR